MEYVDKKVLNNDLAVLHDVDRGHLFSNSPEEVSISPSNPFKTVKFYGMNDDEDNEQGER